MEAMSTDEIAQLVRDVGLGHLCLASDGDAYGLPVFYAFDGTTFFFQSRPGLKEEFAQDTREACLLITRAESPDQWQSVQAFGPVEKVVRGEARFQAADALMKVPFPPTRGHTGAGTPARSPEDVYVWCLRPTRWSGRQSRPLPG